MAGDKFYEDFGQGRSRAPKKAIPAIAKIGVAGLGGLVAGRVDKLIFDWEATKKFAAAGTVGVFAVAVAMEYFAPDSAVGGILRQVAAGMGGWVGDDAWYLLVDLIGLGTKDWKPQTPYKMGAEVKWVGAKWTASKDIPYPPQAEPGKDSRWVRKAQGFRLASQEDYRAAAQALLSDDQLWDQLASDQAAIFGPDIEEAVSRQIGAPFQFDQHYRDELKQRAKAVLGEVVQSFGNGV